MSEKRTGRRVVFRRWLPAACLALPLLFSIGCVHRTTGLRFSSTLSGQQFGQRFNRAYFDHTQQGDYDIVLLDDGLRSPTSSGGNAPLQPVPVVSLNQFIHLHVLWKPLHGNKVDAPSTTNAIIDWYVRTNEFVDQPARLHYRGAGYVSVYDGKQIARFVVRAGSLNLVDQTGQMHDPLGSTSLSGSFKAAHDPSLVASLMNSQEKDLKDATASVAEPSAPSSPQVP